MVKIGPKFSHLLTVKAEGARSMILKNIISTSICYIRGKGLQWTRLDWCQATEKKKQVMWSRSNWQCTCSCTVTVV